MKQYIKHHPWKIVEEGFSLINELPTEKLTDENKITTEEYVIGRMYFANSPSNSNPMMYSIPAAANNTITGIAVNIYRTAIAAGGPSGAASLSLLAAHEGAWSVCCGLLPW